MRGLLRTCMDARDVVAHIDASLASGVAVDPSDVRLQIAFVLDDAKQFGLILEVDQKFVVDGILGPGAVDAPFFDGIRLALNRVIESRVVGCTAGFAPLEVRIVRSLVPYLGIAVIRAAVLEVPSILLEMVGRRPEGAPRISSADASAGWLRRQLYCERRSLEAPAYLDDQLARVAKARREVRWARDQLTLLSGEANDVGFGGGMGA